MRKKLTTSIFYYFSRTKVPYQFLFLAILDPLKIENTRIFSTVKINMLLAGWEVRTGKNCDRGLENEAEGSIFKPEVAV